MPKPYRKSLLSFLLPRLGGDSPPQRSKTTTPMFQGVSIHINSIGHPSIPIGKV
jgi:hypothetical protein